jgi:hypothetical protein
VISFGSSVLTDTAALNVRSSSPLVMLRSY